MLGAGSRTVKLITSIPTIIDAITEVGIIDALAIAAVFAAPGTRGDLAHEGEERLAGCQLPLLSLRLTQDRLDTLTCTDVRLGLGPVTIVLADLGTAVCCQGVGRQVVLGLVAKPVGGSRMKYREIIEILMSCYLPLILPGPKQVTGKFCSEVVLVEALHSHQVAAIPAIISVIYYIYL